MKFIKYIFVFLICQNAFAQVQLNGLFQNHMVLQRNQPIAIFGTAKSETKVTVTFKDKTYSAKVVDTKWKLFLDKMDAGGPYRLTVKGNNEISISDVLVGEVWLCSGQSNMEMPVKGNYGQPINGSNLAILESENSQLRLFEVKKSMKSEPSSDVSGNWTLAKPATVKNFSATAYFFGKFIQEKLNVPVGLINSSWGGTPAESWMPKSTLDKDFGDFKEWNHIPSQPHKSPIVLYNGMIHPLIPFTIKGVIWYQGEANKKRAKQYSQLFPSMIKSWRNEWGQGDFPFYFVQIAPFAWGGDENNALLRESQLKSMQSVLNSGMVVTLDIGEAYVIHPSEKRKVGERLALWALAKDYGYDAIEYSGPVYKSMEVKENKVTLQFDYAPLGVCTLGKELMDFEIAGEDKVFHVAEVKIIKGELVVWSDRVEQPVAVRYGWKGYIDGSLFNTAGLPASSFRTDDW